jgi:hypothetical protein
MTKHWITETRSIDIPDYRFKSVSSELQLVPLRGISSFLAVMAGNMVCLGYIDTLDLGFQNVLDYIKGQ